MTEQAVIKRKFLVEGPVPPEKLSDLIVKHNSKRDIGAHTFFTGQVRDDSVDGRRVTSIIYTSYEEMAENILGDIKEEAMKLYDLSCAHIYHSIGEVKAGEMSLLVMVSASHRRDTFPALKYIVEQIKAKAPVWKKEIYEDESYKWVSNEESAMRKNGDK